MIEGLDKLYAVLDALPDALLNAAEPGLNAALELAVAEAKSLAPVRTGQLRDSITSATQRQDAAVVGQVIATAAHAVFVELGDSGHAGGAAGGHASSPASGSAGSAARPFLYPAIVANEGKMLELVAQAAGNIGGGV